MRERFDGHANCFVEWGDGKAMLIDFNFETEPLPRHLPDPAHRPLQPAEGVQINHWGKLAFKWLYWNVLPPAGDCRCRRRCRWPGRNHRPNKSKSKTHEEVATMPTATIDGRSIHLDAEGFLTDPSEWDPDLARFLAGQIGIDLTDGHWAAIEFARSDYGLTGRRRSAGWRP